MAWPVGAKAQQLKKQHRLAFVHSGIPADQLTEAAGPFWVRRFYQTLRGLGDVEGDNLVVERCSAEGHSDRFAAVVATVVSGKPDVIVAKFTDLIRAFAAATSTIPIVALSGDPIVAGLVTSLAHPGGNVTGASTSVGNEIARKRLQILKEAIPSTARVGYLSLLTTWGRAGGLEFREAEQHVGITLIANFLPEVTDTKLHACFADMAQQRLDAAMVDKGGSLLAYGALIVALAEKYRIPTMYPYRDYAEAGGLMTYAPDLGELAERLANDVHQILTGTNRATYRTIGPPDSS